jgi:radical SAM-linked protein
MSEIRQRWRLVVGRGSEARDVPHREIQLAWEVGLRNAHLPLAETHGAQPRPRITFAAPVPVGMLADRELIDIGLAERRRVDEVRRAATGAAPPGYRLVELYDVWAGEPPLTGQVAAGDYRVSVDSEPAPTRAVEAEVGPVGQVRAGEGETSALDELLAAPVLERTRDKGGGAVTVDIRPHLIEMRLDDTGGAGLALLMRLRLGGDGGVGRPEEIVDEYARRLGRPLTIRTIVRERIVLASELKR